MRRNTGCLRGVVGILAALLLCCLVAWFIGLPRIQGAIEDGVAEVVSTEMAGRIGEGVAVEPGTYRISFDELTSRLTDDRNQVQVTGVTISGDGDRINVQFSADQSDASFSFLPSVTSDGHLELGDIQGDGGLARRLLSPETVASAVERGVNDYLDANNLTLAEVYVDGNELVLVIE